MSSVISHCPMTSASCSFASQDIRPNSFFLIQPFDSDKVKREKAIEYALKKFYGDGRYQLKKSDKKVHLKASYCDICLKIRSCQYCIADVSGEILDVINEGESKKRAYLRPNIPFELGLAFGLNKPSILLFKKLMEDHRPPSDLDFIRYVDITAKNWSMISQRLLDTLRDKSPDRAIVDNLKRNVFNRDRLKKDIESVIHQKEELEEAKYKNIKINFILLNNNKLVGIIKNIKGLIIGTHFNIYVSENFIEEKKGVIRIDSVNEEKGTAQTEIYVEDYLDFWAAIAKDCCEKGQHMLGDHRLEVIIPAELERLSIEELKSFRSILDKYG
jgi:hypothetical protein